MHLSVLRVLLLLNVTVFGCCQGIIGPTNQPVQRPPKPAEAAPAEPKPEGKTVKRPPAPQSPPAGTVTKVKGPPLPTKKLAHADVARIKAGMKREEVIEKLGPPSSKTTLPDDGHLVEVYRYLTGNTWLATVRLDNGTVVTIESPDRERL